MAHQMRVCAVRANLLTNPARATGGHTAHRRPSARIGRGKFPVAAISLDDYVPMRSTETKNRSDGFS
ncbi:hypothetical protein U9M48_027759 [Paspalum notatum var. saurae]|uniref:Uncharacterized protein n=1 Tax=Paspalum notatum var. saurae TaxID=547442 RepID=A0AAQ3TVG8_PASNO